MDTFFLTFFQYAEQIPKMAVYAVISVSSVLQQWFPPYPGDSFAIAAGFMSGCDGYDVFLLFLTFWLSTVLSTAALFEVGAAMGKRLLQSRAVLRFFPAQKQLKAHKTADRFGAWTFFLCKFLPGINSIAVLVGATLGFGRRRAYMGMITAALVHNLLFFTAGLIIGKNLDRITAFVKTYNIAAFILLGAVIAAAAVIFIKNRIKKRKENNSD